MHDKLMAAISLGGYALAPMLGRIATAWARGELTDAEREELEAAARDRARPEDSYAPAGERLSALEAAVAEVRARLAALERGADASDEPADEWPAYAQPSGAHDAYRAGDRVSFGGRRWECSMDGCVWSPADYPAAWREVVDAETEEA